MISWSCSPNHSLAYPSLIICASSPASPLVRLLSPTVPYSIPLLGSSLVRTSTSLSSRPLSCVLCLVHLRPTARKAYPDWIDDRVHQFPKGYKVPEFVLFSGEEKKSTIEHIARFSVQCGEARSKDLPQVEALCQLSY